SWALLGLAALAAPLSWWARRADARQAAAEVQWIWFDEGDPLAGAPAGARYFRRTFTINRPVPRPVDEAALDLTAAGGFTAWVNGAEVGRGEGPRRVLRFDVRKHLVHGTNVIAVKAEGVGGPAGLLVRLAYVPNGQSKLALVSDGEWKAAKAAPAGWERVDFDDAGWRPAKALGPFGKAGPWQEVAWAEGKGGGGRVAGPDGV